MAALINQHYHGLVDMGRYVDLRKNIFVESQWLMPFCGPVRMRSEPGGSAELSYPF